MNLTFRLLRCGISGVRWIWTWMAGAILGQSLLDTTDSRPLEASPTPQQSRRISLHERDYREYGIERSRKFPKDVRYSVHTEYSQPLGWISRSNDGRFILDQESSEEGGFTSPRRPIRCIQGKSRPSYVVPRPAWTIREDTGVESGVYHVRAGTASRLDHHFVPPRLSLRSDGSGASTHEEPQRSIRISTSQGFPQYNNWNTSFMSPEFGKHRIPDSPSKGPVLSPRRRVRTSSPRHLSSEWNQLAQLASFSEMSSVQHPSSVERSFPSTVLSSFQKTPSTHECTPQSNAYSDDPRFRSLRELHAIYAQELPPLTNAHQSPHSRNFHVVGAQVHAPQSRTHSIVQKRPLPLYHPPPDHPWATPRRPAFGRVETQYHQNHHNYPMPSRLSNQFYQRSNVRQTPSQYFPMRDGRLQLPYQELMKRQPFRVNSNHGPPYANLIRQPERGLLGSGQHIHSRQYGNIFSHIQPPLIPDIPPRHYVNLPPRRGDIYQRISGQEPHYLLKPSSSENQKPLATSSPPRTRARHRPVPSRHHIQHSLPPPPTGTKPSTKHIVPEIQLVPKDTPNVKSRRDPTNESDSSSDKPIVYTRERLQEAIGRVRSGLFRSNGRHHSAPELSMAGRSEIQVVKQSIVPHGRVSSRRGGGSVPVSHDASHEQSHEISQEQSPDSSSGFGSKNTSQQQSSSQSGQSLSALGLDSSRLECSEMSESLEKSQQQWLPQHQVGQWGPPPQQHPPSYDQWLTRQVLPQFRFPGAFIGPYPTQPSSLLMEIPRHGPSVTEDVSLDASGSGIITEPSTVSRLQQLPALDISVDGHYEFDTVLSPTPGDDNTAMWSRTRIPSGDRGLSDSEIYGSSGRRRRGHESMEARVAAMKQEFHEYRQKQARRRRSREMESVC